MGVPATADARTASLAEDPFRPVISRMAVPANVLLEPLFAHPNSRELIAGVLLSFALRTYSKNGSNCATCTKDTCGTCQGGIMARARFGSLSGTPFSATIWRGQLSELADMPVRDVIRTFVQNSAWLERRLQAYVPWLFLLEGLAQDYNGEWQYSVQQVACVPLKALIAAWDTGDAPSEAARGLTGGGEPPR
jgi:hypothetical protein